MSRGRARVEKRHFTCASDMQFEGRSRSCRFGGLARRVFVSGRVVAQHLEQSDGSRPVVDRRSHLLHGRRHLERPLLLLSR